MKEHHHPIAAGKSSFDLVDFDKLVSQLAINPGEVVADLGCGAGNYTLALAAAGKKISTLHALDLWGEGIEQLKREAAQRGYGNVHPAQANIGEKLPLEDRSVDLALMATVFHDLVEDGTGEGALNEVKRVLKPNGRFALVEFKKVEGRRGPPQAVRISAPELAEKLSDRGFKELHTTDLGPDLYLSVFELK